MTEAERVAQRARRGRAAFVAVGVLLCVGVTYAIVENFDQDTRITKVEKSPCLDAPAGKPCQKSKRKSDRKRSIADTCIAFWKVGYPCPRPGSEAAAVVPVREGGDALQQPSSTAHEQPGPSGGRDEGSEGDRTPKPTDPAGADFVPTGSETAHTESEPHSSAASPGIADPLKTPPGLLTPTVDKVSPVAKPVIEKVCDVAAKAANLC